MQLGGSLFVIAGVNGFSETKYVIADSVFKKITSEESPATVDLDPFSIIGLFIKGIAVNFTTKVLVIGIDFGLHDGNCLIAPRLFSCRQFFESGFLCHEDETHAAGIPAIAVWIGSLSAGHCDTRMVIQPEREPNETGLEHFHTILYRN